MDEIKYPNIFKSLYICLFKERNKWKYALAASILTDYAFANSDDKLFEVVEPLQTRLWKEIYKNYQ
jgi:hypothetical protein